MAALPFLGSPAPAADSVDPLLREWVAGFLPVPESGGLRMHKFETTQAVYRLIAGTNPSRWTGEANSVEMVSWDEAVAFCQQATEKLRAAGLLSATAVIRLPSEQEWEHACRAGTTTAYSFGDDPARLAAYAWYTGNAAGNDPPAGALKPNAWGFYDFHGYVWEWCSDPDGDRRPIRGGAWTSSAAACRSDSRQLAPRDQRTPDLGFRCVLVAGS